MKVLQLIQTRQKRGAEIFASQLSNHLKELGHEVIIVSIYDGDADLKFSGQFLTLEASFLNRFLDFSAWKKLSNIINSFHPDIIQTNAGDTLKYAVFSKAIYGWQTPIVVRNASEVGRYIRTIPQKIFNAYLYRNVDQVISVSNASEKDILHLFPFLKGKTCVIGVGLDETVEISTIKLIPANKKHILHVGGFSFEKNHEGLLKIFRIILRLKTDVHLHLVGDGPLRREIEKSAKNLNLLENITFYGFVNNPLNYIKAADVLILPSIIEGLPGVLLEAMYCKTPVVAYEVGGVGEIVKPETGTLIFLNKEDNFANATIEVLENPSAKKINTAYKMVIEHFMNDHITSKFIKSYNKLKI